MNGTGTGRGHGTEGRISRIYCLRMSTESTVLEAEYKHNKVTDPTGMVNHKVSEKEQAGDPLSQRSGYESILLVQPDNVGAFFFRDVDGDLP